MPGECPKWRPNSPAPNHGLSGQSWGPGVSYCWPGWPSTTKGMGVSGFTPQGRDIGGAAPAAEPGGVRHAGAVSGCC